jgi:hypothetical protein
VPSRFAKENRWWAVEHAGDPDVRIYHVKTRLMDANQAMGAFQGAQNMAPDVLGVDLSPVILLLLEIRGVVAVDLRAHQFVVRKAPVYDWDEIEERILELLYGVKLAEQIEIAAAEGFADIERRRRERAG